MEIDRPPALLIGQFLRDDAAVVDLLAPVALEVKAAEAFAMDRVAAARDASPTRNESTELHPAPFHPPDALARQVSARSRPPVKRQAVRSDRETLDGTPV
jgi:hypothetical protein